VGKTEDSQRKSADNATGTKATTAVEYGKSLLLRGGASKTSIKQAKTGNKKKLPAKNKQNHKGKPEGRIASGAKNQPNPPAAGNNSLSKDADVI